MPVVGTRRELHVLAAGPRQAVDRAEPLRRDLAVGLAQRHLVKRRRDVALGQHQHPFVVDVDGDGFDVARPVRVLEVDLPVDLRLVLDGPLDAHVDDDLRHPRNRHDVRDLQIFLKLRMDGLTVRFL